MKIVFTIKFLTINKNPKSKALKSTNSNIKALRNYRRLSI